MKMKNLNQEQQARFAKHTEIQVLRYLAIPDYLADNMCDCSISWPQVIYFLECHSLFCKKLIILEDVLLKFKEHVVNLFGISFINYMTV